MDAPKMHEEHPVYIDSDNTHVSLAQLSSAMRKPVWHIRYLIQRARLPRPLHATKTYTYWRLTAISDHLRRHGMADVARRLEAPLDQGARHV